MTSLQKASLKRLEFAMLTHQIHVEDWKVSTVDLIDNNVCSDIQKHVYITRGQFESGC